MNRSRALENMRTTAQIVRGYRGPALFSFGFRPFFLLAAIFGFLAVPMWVIGLMGVAFAENITRDWHAHEMLFGYCSAVIAGYLFVAGANWTGSYPVAGAPLIALVSLWTAGRAAMIVGGGESVVAAAVDSMFLPLFSAALWREQLAARKGRNLIPCLVVTLLAVANIAFHLRLYVPASGLVAERAALGLISLLIAVVGGRLVPSFTCNWIANRKAGREPEPYGRVDLWTNGLTASALAAWLFAPGHPVSGVFLALSGLATIARMARWRGWKVRRDPGLVALHCGYLWLALGFVLLGLSICDPGLVSQSSAVHAISAGAIGGMTLVMMIRMTLNHTGRDRSVGIAGVLVYVCVNLAALLRVAAPFFPDNLVLLLVTSAVLWSGAFGTFVFVYGPMLVTRRAVRRTG